MIFLTIATLYIFKNTPLEALGEKIQSSLSAASMDAATLFN